MTERGKREVQKFEYHKKKRSLLDEKKAFFMIF